MSVAMKRKEEFLGARVPKVLRDRVMQRASDLGVPVSILIRTILEEAFAGGQTAGRNVAAPSPQAPISTVSQPVRFPSVLGWEEIKLNRQMDCSGCGRRLAPGMLVTLGLGLSGEGHVILCDQCKDRI
ncbi:MAG: hypothetical protein M3A44_14080 [Gammaproteobacteria bacterium]